MYLRRKTSRRACLQIVESRRDRDLVRRRYVEGAGGQTHGRNGFSKHHRPDLCQVILAVLISGDGHPMCSKMWKGNTADVTTLIPVIERLCSRFAIARACIVPIRA